jgi:type IV pilus assembly protein PilE
MRTKPQRAQSGVTLLELLIVVAIVAILGTIAVANYRGNVLRSNRAEAKAALMQLQAAQEKYYLSANEYATTLAQLKLTANTERRIYTIRLQTNADKEGYTATASATGSQAADTACPTFSITETGTRTPTPGTSPCW